jgi:hypothetical protein
LNLVESISDPHLFEPWFRGASWNAWRTVLKASCAVPLDDDELATFRTLSERDPPTSPVSELWTIVGRRGGKDSIASMIGAHYAAVPDYRPYLRPGETPLVMCLAVDRPQARIVRNYAGSYFDRIELLASLKADRDRRDGFELNNGVELSVGVSNFRSVRGRPVPCAIFDEVAFWRDLDSASPDIEVYNATTPAMATMPNALLVGISSPYRRTGLLWDKYKTHFGKGGDILVIKAPSLTMNPTLNPRIIAEALERDPVAAAAEWLAEFRTDIDAFISREIVETLIAPDRRELPPMIGKFYVAFVDPSGGSVDSMTLAVAHREYDKGQLDAIREWRPPFSPESVVKEAAELLRSYGISEVTGDRYAGEWPRERFQLQGITYLPSERSKGDIYREFLPLMNGARVELLDNARLTAQLCGLERRVARSGKDSIDHAPNGHDDIANSAAGALVRCVGDLDEMETWRKLAA